ncbi:DODA-type extradiol aromatic ring-opening family dioxygenase [Acuticoccus mangrovi]|nr:class III extradiol ring-cleavage dioxygenase [Acuticoccus mangrovi]
MRSLFVSHGAPNLVLHNSAARDFLARYAEALPRPKAIVVASAHFEAPGPVVSAASAPRMIYDFRGFEPELYEITYSAPGDPALARDCAERLAEAGFAPRLVERGFDHGTWVPLSLLWPAADIPVVTMSVDPGSDAATHVAMGAALAPLTEEGVLVVGSGSLTHNLMEFFRGGYRPDSPAPEWVKAFGAWVHETISAGALDDLVAWRTKAPYGPENHPTPEHLLPLFVALGAAGAGATTERVHSSHSHGILQMDAYAFG